jgi:ribosomal protein L9
MSNHTPHKIICHKLHATQNKPNQGTVQVIFEKFDKDLYSVNQKKMFCESKKVFITSKYEEIEKYKDRELFALETTGDSHNSGECGYLSNSSPTKLAVKDIIEIINLKLPEPSQRIVNIDYLPSTKYIFIKDNDGYLYGAFEYIVRESLSGGFNLELSTPDLFNKSLFNKNIANNYVHKISLGTESILEAKIKQINKRFIINIDDKSFKESGIYDYRNDEDIIKAGNDILKKIGSDGFTKSQIKDLKRNVQDINDLGELDNNTIERFFPLFEKMEEWERIGVNITQEYFKSEYGKKYLNNYIENDKDTYFENIKLDLEKKAKEETQELKNEIEEIKEIKNELEAENTSLDKQISEKEETLNNIKPDDSLKEISEDYTQNH